MQDYIYHYLSKAIMTPIVKHHQYMSQINMSPVYPETVIHLVDKGNTIIVYQNDEIISLFNAPIMKVVRAIRSMYNNAKIILI